MTLEHLGLSDWPFRIVPSREYARFLADRTMFRQDLVKMMHKLSRRSQSSMHLLWSWFGAGKTHSLLYLANQCEIDYPAFLPVYTEFPRDSQSFLSVFRAFANSYDLDTLVRLYLEVATAPSMGDLNKLVPRNLANALTIYITGQPRQQQIAQRWLKGERVPISTLREIGIDQNIDSVEAVLSFVKAVVYMWATVIRAYKSTHGRIIWVLDEYQRIEKLPRAIRLQINDGLQATFNSCPDYLTIILSFGGKPQASFPEWLGPELADRIGIEPVLVLPPLIAEEAMLFVENVLSNFRPDGFDKNIYFPYTEGSVRRIIDIIRERAELKPRYIMQFFEAVLEEADTAIKHGQIKEISPAFAAQALEGRMTLLKKVEETEDP